MRPALPILERSFLERLAVPVGRYRRGLRDCPAIERGAVAITGVFADNLVANLPNGMVVRPDLEAYLNDRAAGARRACRAQSRQGLAGTRHGRACASGRDGDRQTTWVISRARRAVSQAIRCLHRRWHRPPPSARMRHATGRRARWPRRGTRSVPAVAGLRWNTRRNLMNPDYAYVAPGRQMGNHCTRCRSSGTAIRRRRAIRACRRFTDRSRCSCGTADSQPVWISHSSRMPSAIR